MTNKKSLLTALLLLLCAGIFAQEGSISKDMLNSFRTDFQNKGNTKALQNAVTGNNIQKLAVNYDNPERPDTYFSNRVKTKGITNQKSSGRCWLFASLNVMRPKVIEKYSLKDFEFSQNYSFFYDQLEKANLFLQEIIVHRDKAMDDRTVEWLFKHPIQDGGVWNGFVNVVEKYGLVPAEVMPETFQSENTRMIQKLLSRKLREYGLELRAMAAEGKKAKALETRKTEMLSEVYRILAISLGEPPQTFSWRYEDAEGVISESKEYTPMSFYKEAVGLDLRDYVLMMNDPSRPLNKTFEIEYDRNVHEGINWIYVNLSNEIIKEAAKKSILANEAMYFSCDVGKQLNRDKGILDVNYYDYGDIFDIDFTMDKKERVQTFESGSSHGMTLVAVDLDKEGNIKKWLLENSWGQSGFNGHLIMTDKWFDEYMFRVVVHKKFVPENVLKMMQEEPTMLPPWDPMFAPEN